MKLQDYNKKKIIGILKTYNVYKKFKKEGRLKYIRYIYESPFPKLYLLHFIDYKKLVFFPRSIEKDIYDAIKENKNARDIERRISKLIIEPKNDYERSLLYLFCKKYNILIRDNILSYYKLFKIGKNGILTNEVWYEESEMETYDYFYTVEKEINKLNGEIITPFYIIKNKLKWFLKIKYKL